MSDALVAYGDLGWLTIPVGDITDASAFKQNEIVGCPALLPLSNIAYTAANQSCVFSAYVGIATNPFAAYTGTKLESKKVAFETVTKLATPIGANFGFGAYCLEDLVGDGEKYNLFMSDVAAQVADYIEVQAMTAFATAANKIAVTDFAVKALSQDVVNKCAAKFGKLQRQPKSLIVHPDVYARIKTILGTFSVAGNSNTIISGEANLFGGCQVFQSSNCACVDGVYTSYIVRNAAYQYGMPADLRLEQQTERGYMEKYLMASFMYVDHSVKDSQKRVVEFTHLLEEAA